MKIFTFLIAASFLIPFFSDAQLRRNIVECDYILIGKYEYTDSMINDADEYDYRILIDKTLKQPQGSKAFQSMLTSYFQFRNYAPPSCPPLPPEPPAVVRPDEEKQSYIFFIEAFKGRYYITERIEDTSERMQAHIRQYIALDKLPDSRKKMHDIIDWKIKALESSLEIRVGDYISPSGIFFRYYQQKGYFSEFPEAFTKQQKERLLNIALKRLDICIAEKKELGYEMEELLPMLHLEYPKEISQKLLQLLDVEVTDFYSLYDVRTIFDMLYDGTAAGKEAFVSEFDKINTDYYQQYELKEKETELEKRRLIYQYTKQLKKIYLEADGK